MANNILSDFVVALGFKVDERSLQQAVAAPEKVVQAEQKAADAKVKIAATEAAKVEKIETEAAKKARDRREAGLKQIRATAVQVAEVVGKITLAVEGAAGGILAVTDQAAKGFERLNYAAQRAQSSPKAFNAFTYAASQLGSSVEAASSQLEAFGAKLRNPGYVATLERLGVHTKTANGHLRETADIATDLGAILAKTQNADPKYGYMKAMQRANMFGFDEISARAMMDPRFGGLAAQQKSDQAKVGADANAAAAGGTAFEQSMRRLKETLDGIGTRVETGLFDKLQPQLDTLQKWAADHGQQIADVVGTIADRIIKLATAIVDWLAKVDWKTVGDNLDRLASQFETVAKRLTGKDGLTAAFEAFGLVLAARVLAPLAGIVRTLGVLGGVTVPPWLLAMLGIAGAGAVAGAMNSPHTDEFGRDAGTWGGDAPGGGDGAHLRHRKSHNPQSLGSRLWGWAKGQARYGRFHCQHG